MTCCLCGKEIKGKGNNPYPLCDQNDFDSKCCDQCNSLVLDARLYQLDHKITKKVIDFYKDLAKKIS